jgi:hypothetical protein
MEQRLESIVNILRTRRFDRENDLAVSYRVNGKWRNAKQTLSEIKKVIRPMRTNVYQIDYRVDGGFLYTLKVDAVNKNEAKGHVIRENPEGHVTIVQAKKASR